MTGAAFAAKTNEEIVMNWDQVQGQWKQLKGAAKEKWGKLTDDDLDQIGGRRDQFIGKLQERYGIAQEEAKKQVDDWKHADTHATATDAEPIRRKAS